VAEKNARQRRQTAGKTRGKGGKLKEKYTVAAKGEKWEKM
jgi:hypothetical protein